MPFRTPVPQDDDPLYTTEQFADKAQIHYITAILWRRNGKGPAFISRGGDGEAVFIRYRLSDINAWLDSARKNTKPETEGERTMRVRAKAGTAEHVEFESSAGTHAVRNATKGAVPARKKRGAAK